MVWEKREAEGVMKNSGVARRLPRLGAPATVVHGDGGDSRKSRPTSPAKAIRKSCRWRRCRRRSSTCSACGRCMAGRSSRAKTPFGRNRVVILGSRALAAALRRRSGRRGRSIMLNGSPHQGRSACCRRMPRFPTREAQFFLPLVMFRRPDEPPSRTSHNFSVYARLKPGVSFEQARAEMDRIGKDLEKTVSATEPRSRRARDVAARRDHRPRRAHAGRADGGGRRSSC